MKKIYRGFEISSEREKCLGGWDEVYWSAYREADGWELACGFGDGTVKEMFKCMKNKVDLFLDNYKGSIEEYEKYE